MRPKRLYFIEPDAMPEALDALSLAEAALIALVAASDAADMADDAELSADEAEESIAGGVVVAMAGAVASDAADEAGASSFFPQAERDRAATMEASRSDLFMCVLKFIGVEQRP